MIRFIKFYKCNLKSFFTVISICFLPFFSTFAQKYVVVLDAGHGGKDQGASNGSFIEKHIALKVTLEVGKILKKNTLISVKYTRKKDVFVELHKRASLANNKEAVLFVSIHCDSFKPRPAAYGASTYVLGLNGNKANMEISKKENAVILLEDNYKNNYDYDPNSPESVIGLSVLQEENLDASLAFASIVQSNFVVAKRKDRSVKQANFLVLRETVMPSVLIELGFLSNNREAKFLNSKTGQKRLAKAVATAIEEYVEQIHINTISKNNNASLKTVKKNKKTVSISSKKQTKKQKLISKKKVIKKAKKELPKKKVTKKTSPKKTVLPKLEFRVQIAASKTYLTEDSKHFKGLKNIKVEILDDYYKYYYGSSSDFYLIKEYLLDVKDAGIKDAFIVAFRNGQKISLKEALKK